MKDFILSQVRRISVDDLVKHILEGTVTFDELRKTGNFPHSKQEAVKAKLNAIRSKYKEEDNAWQIAKSEHTVYAYQQYLQKYPNGRFVNNAKDAIQRLEIEEKEFKEERTWQTAKYENTISAYEEYQHLYPNGKYYSIAGNKIADIREEIEGRKQYLLNDIRRNPKEYPPDAMKHHFKARELTERDLISNNIITERALRTFFNPPTFQNDILDWGDLAPLKPNRTDIFFLGIPGSGKSCLLGGLLYYSRKKGYLRVEGNLKGKKYGDALIKTTKIGYVPPSTPVDGVNYIEAVLRDREDVEHPINIVEMSGEKMKNTYEYGTTSVAYQEEEEFTTIGVGEYLHNDNRKIIFFVIDYKQTIDNDSTQSIADQNAILDAALTLLNEDKIFERTKDVYIVLTKSDLLPGGADNLEAAKDFVEEEYLAFWKNTKEFGKDYGFGVKILTYSLGRVMLGTTFEFNPKYSENIYNAIIASSFVEKKKTGFLGRFSKK